MPPAKAIALFELAKSTAICFIDSVEIPVILLVFSRVQSERFLKVDGTDFFAVHQAAKEAVERAKNNEGPTLLHVKLSRVYGHYEGDAITYRLDEETKDIRDNKDPIKIFKRKVTESGLLEESQLEEIEKNIKKEIEDAVSESKEAKYPAESDLLTDVYVKY